jgi:hypothetical protein
MPKILMIESAAVPTAEGGHQHLERDSEVDLSDEHAEAVVTAGRGVYLNADEVPERFAKAGHAKPGRLMASSQQRAVAAHRRKVSQAHP